MNIFLFHQLDFQKLKKNLNRFLDTNKKWSKGRSKSLKDVYYKFFSTSNWVSLDEDTKSRHTIDCKECLKFSVQTNYPTVASKTEKTKKNLKENLVAGVSDSLHQSFIELDENNLKSKKTCNEFTTEAMSSHGYTILPTLWGKFPRYLL